MRAPPSTFLLFALLGCTPTGEPADTPCPCPDPDTDPGEDTAHPDTAPDTAPPEETGDTGGLVLQGSASATMGDYNPHLAVVTVTVDHDATVWVEYGAQLPGDRSTPTHPVAAGVPTDLLVLGLKAGLDHALVVHAEAGEATWESAPLTVTAPPLADGFQRCLATTLVDRHDPDEVYCTNGTTSAGRTWFCVDHLGDVVYQVASKPEELLYSVRALSTGGWAGVSSTTSLLVLFDERGQPVAQFTPGYFSGKTTWEHQYLDNHEVIELTEGAWAGALGVITGSYEWSPTWGWVYAQGFIIYDVATDTVLWDWSTFGDLADGVAGDPLFDYGRSGFGWFTYDWGHGNSLAHRVEDDGREVFWMSLRSQDWIVKVDVETGAVVWRFGQDGDFELVDDLDAATPTPRPVSDWMYGQHDLVFHEHDGARTSFTVFDNGYYRDDGSGGWTSAYSRIVEYRLDEETMLAEQVFAYGPPHPAHPEYLYAWGMGGARILRGDDRVAWSSGYGVGAGYAGPFLREVSYPDGELLWTLDCVDYGDGFYRVSWFPSLYELDWVSAGG